MIDATAAVHRLESAGPESEAVCTVFETVAETNKELATKADVASLKADLIIRIVAAQAAAATFLLVAFRYFG